jgi:predicted DNA-binding protein
MVICKVMLMTERRSTQMVIRLEPTLRERLEAAASADRRPVSNLVRCVLADWLKERASHDQRAA